MHGPTYMGNALACAAANASLDLFEREPRLEQVKAISEQMAHELGACRGMPRCEGRAGQGRDRRGRAGRGSTISMRCARVSWRRACSSARSATSSI